MTDPRIEMWPTDRPTPYENNPRVNDGAVEAVANSIREFGFQSPIIVDSEGVIIAGHTRLKAAQSLRLESVPVIVAADLSDEQARALRLADNKTGEFADWDFDLLGIELADIVDIDMTTFGFSDIPASENDYGDEFELSDSAETKYRNMQLLLANDEYELIRACVDLVAREMPEKETGYPGNEAGRCLHEVVRQWAELKKLSLR